MRRLPTRTRLYFSVPVQSRAFSVDSTVMRLGTERVPPPFCPCAFRRREAQQQTHHEARQKEINQTRIAA